MNLTEEVRVVLRDAAARVPLASAEGRALPDLRAIAWTLDRPKRPEHGHLATNLPLVVSKHLGQPPRVFADALCEALRGVDLIESSEVAGPGFVNIRLHPRAFHRGIQAVLAAGRAFGRAAAGGGERVNVEFVSANPTGPITVAAGRNAVLGDAIALLLEARGCRVTREYYVNDFGNQVRAFGESVFARVRGLPVPEDGYRGAYVDDLANYLTGSSGQAPDACDEAFVRRCIGLMLNGVPGSSALRGIGSSLSELGVNFDVWFSEESLHRWGKVSLALSELERRGVLFEKDGALFFRSPDGGDDKDRVVRKSDGAFTYFASDIAYHADKVRRGYDRVVDILGADHHGYVARVRNVLEALGLPSERFEAILYNLVYIYRAGELVKSSKRAGNVITVDEVLEEIDAATSTKGAGRDAFRFYMLARSSHSNVEFDIELAKKASLENPVFYVQYGHARLCSILRKAEALGYSPAAVTAGDWASLVHPDELALAALLLEFPALVESAAAAREPHKVVFFLQDLAMSFQSYFTRLKGEQDPILPPDSVRAVEGWRDLWDHPKTRSRLAWIEAIRVVYASALSLIGISAPAQMNRPAATESLPTEDERDE